MRILNATVAACAAVVLAAAPLLAASPASAAPVASAPANSASLAATPLLDTGDGDAAVIAVRGGCGFGEHRGFYGGCRINHGPRGRLRAFETGLPRGCPPGLHRGYYGRCI